jgi:hypothetical protein
MAGKLIVGYQLYGYNLNIKKNKKNRQNQMIILDY